MVNAINDRFFPIAMACVHGGHQEPQGTLQRFRAPLPWRSQRKIRKKKKKSWYCDGLFFCDMFSDHDHCFGMICFDIVWWCVDLCWFKLMWFLWMLMWCFWMILRTLELKILFGLKDSMGPKVSNLVMRTTAQQQNKTWHQKNIYSIDYIRIYINRLSNKQAWCPMEHKTENLTKKNLRDQLQVQADLAVFIHSFRICIYLTASCSLQEPHISPR